MSLEYSSIHSRAVQYLKNLILQYFFSAIFKYCNLNALSTVHKTLYGGSNSIQVQKQRNAFITSGNRSFFPLKQVKSSAIGVIKIILFSLLNEDI